jgi:hypothetical protein
LPPSCPASFFGATESVTVGQGGTGGAAVTIDGTNGNDGNPGTNSEFGNLIFPVTSSAGIGGNNLSIPGGEAAYIFSNTLSHQLTKTNTSVSGTTISAMRPGAPPSTAGVRVNAGADGAMLAGAGANATSLGGFIVGTPTVYRFTSFAPTGGGGGATVAGTGGLGGGLLAFDAVTVIQAGATEGQNGVDAPTSGAIIMGGFGGGGGGATFRDGGNGGFPGGGGGGGSGTDNGTNSGAGGDGGDGLVIVIEW